MNTKTKEVKTEVPVLNNSDAHIAVLLDEINDLREQVRNTEQHFDALIDRMVRLGWIQRADRNQFLIKEQL